MCWEMATRTFPTAVSDACSSRSPAHSNPHAREGANILALCWALGNNSANILACLLNSRHLGFPPLFCTQLFSVSQRRRRAHPGLCQHSETTRAFVLTTGLLCQQYSQPYFRVTRARSPRGNP